MALRGCSCVAASCLQPITAHGPGAGIADIVPFSEHAISEGTSMAKRRSEVVAASLLPSWTDADTAMQLVGTSLGLFGADALDPTVVLSAETPLRNALFDVLLSLVEGGALEMRIAG